MSLEYWRNHISFRNYIPVYHDFIIGLDQIKKNGEADFTENQHQQLRSVVH